MKKISKHKVVGVAALCLCAAMTPGLAACNNSGNETYKGVTADTIYVGNTAGTTGALASIGAPFNYGIEAAFHEYSKNGGFSGTYDGEEVKNLKVALKHYDDGGVATSTVTYTQRLIEEDEVFAIVGNFGAYAITANLDIIKEAKIPMVYAAAGNEDMSRDKATGDDRYIFPVQPINSTEGRVLIQRAFAAAESGGLGGTKVGVISNTGDASLAMVKGIKAEEGNLTAEQKGNIVYQAVSDEETGYGTAAVALKNAGCDVVILTNTTNYTKSVNALIDAGFTSENVKVLTTYNNASTTLFDDATTKTFNPIYKDIITGIHAQAWLDISDLTYVYKTEGGLWDSYKALAAQLGAPALYDAGVPGFGEDYWHTAEVLFDYGTSVSGVTPTGYTPFTLSYDAYALAGYIAGDLFCQGLEALAESGKSLTRANYVDAMESKDFHLAMADNISFKDGKRLGVDAFALNGFAAPYYEAFGTYGATTSYVAHSFTKLDDFRK